MPNNIPISEVPEGWADAGAVNDLCERDFFTDQNKRSAPLSFAGLVALVGRLEENNQMPENGLVVEPPLLCSEGQINRIGGVAVCWTSDTAPLRVIVKLC
jgi:hypothetical protein